MRIRPAPLAVLLKRLLRIQRFVIETDQGKFWIDPVSNFGFRLMMEGGEYEPEFVRCVKASLERGGVFVDIGANEGFYTILGARLTGAKGTVIAVEPQDRLIPVIEENLRLNALNDIVLVHAGISDKDGVETLYLTPDVNTGSSGFHQTQKYLVQTQFVPTLTLEQLLDQNNVESVDLMKMDIEGYEYEAILGSQVFASGRVRALALELHETILKQRGRSENEIIAFLERCGYSETRYGLWVLSSA